MWVGKFKIKHKDCWVSPLTEKYDVEITGVPLNSFEEKGKFYHNNIIFLSGDVKEKKKFVTELKKDKSIKKIKVRKDQIITLVEGKDMISINFDKSFFFIKPVIMKGGYEYWEIGCWDRKKLIVFYNEVEKFAKIDILRLRRESPSVFVQQSVSKLTEKQRAMFEYAKENGYYEYPRRISLQDLAKKLNIPRTTFQNHLRKAECKLLNVLLE